MLLLQRTGATISKETGPGISTKVPAGSGNSMGGMGDIGTTVQSRHMLPGSIMPKLCGQETLLAVGFARSRSLSTFLQHFKNTHPNMMKISLFAV